MTLNRFVARGTAAERAAFVPDPPTPASGPDPGYFWYESDTGDTYAWDGAAWQLVSGAGATGDVTGPASAVDDQIATFDGITGKLLQDGGATIADVIATAVAAAVAASGDVVGPGSATDHAIARYDSTTGKLLQDSTPTVEDDGTIANVTDPAALQDAATKNYVDTQIAAVNVGGAAQTSFLVSGGQVVWESAYIFSVSAAAYYIGGVLYSSAADSVTLGAADPADDRIDVIAVDDTGAVVVVAGTAAAQPSEPDIDPGTQLKLGIVLVTAATLAPPAATSTLLYADNAGSPTEWNWTASGGSIDVDSTNNPRTGTKSIEGTAVVAGVYAQGQIGAGTFDPNSVGLLVIYIRSKATWPNKRGLQVSLRSAGVLVGVTVNIERTGTWGFESSITGSYQQVAIPTSQFAVTQGTLIDQVRIADFGGAIGFYLDDLSFQGGATTQPVTGITQAQADARYRRLSVPLVLSAAADVSGDLPLANLAPASAADLLLGRGSAGGAGDWQELTLGSNLALSGTTLNVTGGSGIGDVLGPASAVDDHIATYDGATGKLIQDGGGTITDVIAAAVAAAIATLGPRTVGVTVDGGGAVVTTGQKGTIRIPVSGTITRWTLLADQPGDVEFDVTLDAFASYPPTTSIVASAPPLLSGVDSDTDSTLTGWTTSVTAGDVFGFEIVGVPAFITRATLQIEVAP